MLQLQCLHDRRGEFPTVTFPFKEMVLDPILPSRLLPDLCDDLFGL
jgi:hypothetical protein